MLTQSTLEAFARELASDSPAPGGGSAAALSGCLGAALCRMAAGLTRGKEKFKAVEPEMEEISQKADTIGRTLLSLVDEDTNAYNRVVAAYRMPKDHSEENRLRRQAIQDALKQAALVPCYALKTAAGAMTLAEDLIEKGNPNCMTDAGVAVEMIQAAVRGAAYNVHINLADIRDPAFTADLNTRVSVTLADIDRRTQKIRQKLAAVLKMAAPDTGDHAQ